MKLLLRRASVALFAVVVLAASFGVDRIVRAAEPRLDADAVRAFAGAEGEPEERSRPFRHWVVRVGGGEGAVFSSADAGYEPTGYGGPINVLILITPAGTVGKVKILQHMETPSYMRGASAFLEKFRGAPVSAPLMVGEDLDAMTRATVSSEAIAAAVRLAARRGAREIYGRMDIPPEEKRVAVDWSWAVVAVGFFVLAFVGRRVRVESFRIAVLFAAAGLLGFWGGRFVAVGDVGRFALLTVPPPLPRLSLYALLIVGTVVAFARGNLYCGWVCPFGAFTEVLYKLPVPKLSVSPAFTRRAARLRIIVLAVVLGLVIGTRALDAGAYEPFDQAFAWVGGTLAFVFLAFVLVASVFHYRFFCRYLCAVGGMFGEFAAAGRRVLAPPACEGCHECVKACEMSAVYGERETYIARYICIECGRCSGVCPSGVGPGSE